MKSPSLLFTLCLLLSAAPLLPAETGQHGVLTYLEHATSIEITRCNVSATGEVVIPEFINGKPITVISNLAFMNCVSVSSITLPDSLTAIGSAAFQSCASLTSIRIPAGVTSIGNNPFANCTQLPMIEVAEDNPSFASDDGVLLNKDRTSLIAFPGGRGGHYSIPPSVTSLGISSFHRAIHLTSVAIPAEVTSISDLAFSGCISLTDVAMPDGLTSIGASGFENCHSLSSMTLPESLTSIGPSAFSRTNFRKLHLPDGLTSIGARAFSFCMLLTGMRIPDGVTSIAEWTFEGCFSLNTVIFGAGVTSIGDAAFFRASNLAKAVFLGNAPYLEKSLSFHPFTSNAPGFTTYHFDHSSGFTTPTWEGRPSVNMGSYTPVKLWLLENHLAYDTDPVADLNGDGISLLMAYALNLDPNSPLASFLPQAVVASETLQLSFYSGAEGVTYIPETSSNLIDWSSAGVILSEPDASGVRTASVSNTSSKQFLRLRVEL